MNPTGLAAVLHQLRPSGVALAWRQLLARPWRFAAAVSGIAFASLMMLMQLGFRDALFDSVCLFHQALDGELVIVSRDYDYLADPRSLPRRRLAQALAVPGVQSAGALALTLAQWKNPDTLHDRTIFVVAVEPDAPGLALEGLRNHPHALKLEDHALFDRASRPEFGSVADRLDRGEPVVTELNRRRIRVSGLVRLGTSFAADGNLILGMPAYRRLFPDRPPGAINLALLRLKPDAEPAAVRDRLSATLPDDVRVLTRAELMRHEVDYWARRTPIGFVITAGLVVGFVVGSVIVYQILYTDLTDHLREYAVLKATGCSDAFLHGLVWQQSVILAVGGFVPATALAWGVLALTRAATSLPAGLSLGKSALVLTLTTGMCVLAGTLATRVLRQADPAEVF
jgi:putative ABC transport system permease protein